MTKKSKQIAAIFKRFYHSNPNPKTELVYQSIFELLVSVMLSAQTTDKRVNQVTEKLFKRANTPEKLLALGELELKRYIASINYYPTKAKNILKTCILLLKNHQGQVPRTRQELEALPGVGRKTANVILNVAFQHPEIAVDTHIFRVCNRVGLAHGHTPLIVEKKLLAIVPKQYKQNAHHWLVLHGRYVCKARRPLCQNCLIQDLCEKNSLSFDN